MTEKVIFPKFCYRVMNTDVDINEMYQWCRDHFGILWAYQSYMSPDQPLGIDADNNGCQIILYNEADAMLFRLTWGGRLLWSK